MNPSDSSADPFIVAGPSLRVPSARRHRQVREPRADPGRDRGERGGDRHRRGPPHQHRSGPGRAEPAGLSPARPVHHPAEHGGLLRRGDRSSYLPARPRDPRRGQPREARGAGRGQDPSPKRHRDPDRGRTARGRRIRGHGVHERRSGHGAAAGGGRVRERDAPRGTHRLRPRNLQPLEYPHHSGGGEGAHRGRCGGRDRVRCGRRDGARMRRGADEHRDRGRPASPC